MRLPESDGRVVVEVAGHNVERHVRAAFLYDFQQVFHLLFEDVQMFRHADVEGALGSVETETGALPAGEEHRAHFARADRRLAGGTKLFFPHFDVGEAQPPDGLRPALAVQLFVVKKVVDDRKIGPVYLL